jgi:hypothetical protein
MALSVTFYEKGTGKINGHMSGPTDCVMLSVASDPTPYVLGDYDAVTRYIDLSGGDPTPRERTVMPITQDKTAILPGEALTLSGFPACRSPAG